MKVTTIKPPWPSPAVTVRKARSHALRWDGFRIADSRAIADAR
jgi:hypothetical protein